MSLRASMANGVSPVSARANGANRVILTSIHTIVEDSTVGFLKYRENRRNLHGTDNNEQTS